jgi:biopolymer transport protein ExbB
MRLHRLNNGLGVLAAVGPMLGLLGTVIGMIGAFNAIGSLQGAARSTELARFMSLALVNTAQGLVVAVPATVAFALFRQRIDRLVTDVAVSDLEPLADDLAAGIGAAQRAAGAARRA